MLFRWVTRWLKAYCDHPDPRVAANNAIAVMVGANGPLYPVYVWLLVGKDFWPSLLTLISTPLFCLVPAVARRSSLAGRAMLPIVGIVNTLICVKALGEGSGVALFLLPCILIPALTMRPRERVLQLIMVSLPSAIYLLGKGHYGAPPIRLHGAAGCCPGFAEHDERHGLFGLFRIDLRGRADAGRRYCSPLRGSLKV